MHEKENGDDDGDMNSFHYYVYCHRRLLDYSSDDVFVLADHRNIVAWFVVVVVAADSVWVSALMCSPIYGCVGLMMPMTQQMMRRMVRVRLVVCASNHSSGNEEEIEKNPR